jgi:hypothetical protein
MSEKCTVYDFYEYKDKLQRESLTELVKKSDRQVKDFSESMKRLDEMARLWEQYKDKESKKFDSICKQYGITIKGEIV